MPRQLYPGQHTFHILKDMKKQAKRRADTRTRVSKLRQNRSGEQIAKTNLLQTQWRQSQKQQLQNINSIAENLMLEQATKKYVDIQVSIAHI